MMEKNQYTIQIRQNNIQNNEPLFSAYCKEWDIVADDNSLPEALSGLFSAIHTLEQESHSHYNPQKQFKKTIDIRIPLYA